LFARRDSRLAADEHASLQYSCPRSQLRQIATSFKQRPQLNRRALSTSWAQRATEDLRRPAENWTPPPIRVMTRMTAVHAAALGDAVKAGIDSPGLPLSGRCFQLPVASPPNQLLGRHLDGDRHADAERMLTRSR